MRMSPCCRAMSVCVRDNIGERTVIQPMAVRCGASMCGTEMKGRDRRDDCNARRSGAAGARAGRQISAVADLAGDVTHVPAAGGLCCGDGIASWREGVCPEG